MLTPVITLISWTIIVLLWMYSTRLPAMRKAGLDPQDAIHPGALSQLPTSARVVADNYNHLHEQPTIFYALAFYTHLVGNGDQLNIVLAWAYVCLRVAHTLTQIIVRNVLLRFLAFVLASFILLILLGRNIISFF